MDGGNGSLGIALSISRPLDPHNPLALRPLRSTPFHSIPPLPPVLPSRTLSHSTRHPGISPNLPLPPFPLVPYPFSKTLFLRNLPVSPPPPRHLRTQSFRLCCRASPIPTFFAHDAPFHGCICTVTTLFLSLSNPLCLDEPPTPLPPPCIFEYSYSILYFTDIFCFTISNPIFKSCKSVPCLLPS